MHSKIWRLAIATLTIPAATSLAAAQLILSDSGLVSPNPLVTYDLGTGTITPIAGWPEPLGPGALAADEANQVLYLVTTAGQLYRWPYADPAPTPVGPGVVPNPPQGMTFANGHLYVGFRNICRTQVYEIDPATAAATLWFDNFAVGQYAAGLAYDPAADSVLSVYDSNGSSTGGPCGGLAPGPLGVHALDPVSQSSTLLAGYPMSAYFTSATVGDGKLWLHSKSTGVFDNLDLTTLVWDPSPPANTMTYGLAGWQGVTWAPIFVFGDAGPTTYCTAKASSAGCLTQISTSSPASPQSGAGGYTVDATLVQGFKNGLLFGGISGPANLPFSGGTLCVTPPTKRGPLANSGGSSLVSCDGQFSTLVNDGLVIPFGLDAGSGNTGWYQCWYRDPQNGAGDLGTALSDAVELSFL